MFPCHLGLPESDPGIKKSAKIMGNSHKNQQNIHQNFIFKNHFMQK